MVKVHQLKSGDEIEIIRSGEVIPKFLSVIKSSKSQFKIPDACPSCHSKVEIVDIRILCRNESCPVRVRESILNFVKKIGIDDLNEKRIDEMINKGIVTDISDIYKLTRDDLFKLDKVKDKLADKLLLNIESKKSVPLVNFMASLGISGGAYNKCEKVVHSGYETLDKFMSITEDQLLQIDGFAEKSAHDFYASFQEKTPLIKRLLKSGVEVVSEVKKETKVSGIKICITGALSEKRSTIEDNIRASGGIVVSSVSKNTDLLVTNEQTSDSSKFKKATELGIKIVNEQELKEMLKA